MFRYGGAVGAGVPFGEGDPAARGDIDEALQVGIEMGALGQEKADIVFHGGLAKTPYPAIAVAGRPV